MSCCKSSKQKLCMNQDIKNKIETNFGPVEEILESFKYTITENQLFTQVNQLLQGSEGIHVTLIRCRVKCLAPWYRKCSYLYLQACLPMVLCNIGCIKPLEDRLVDINM